MSEFVDHVTTLAGGIGTTFFLTASAFLVGAVLGLPIAGARNSGWLPLRVLGGAYVEVTRGIPPIAWLFILYYGIAQFDIEVSSMAAAVWGLGLISSGYLAEIYRSGLRAVPYGQTEAARAVGLTPYRLYRHVVGPQAIATVTPPAVSFAIGLLKDSAVASVIGVEDITALALAETKQEFQGLTIFAAAGVVYLAISFPIAVLGRWAAARLTRAGVVTS
ncbi:MAG: amino acid ABC transporter permease [Micromonosporaceae bacterium]